MDRQGVKNFINQFNYDLIFNLEGAKDSAILSLRAAKIPPFTTRWIDSEWRVIDRGTGEETKREEQQ